MCGLRGDGIVSTRTSMASYAIRKREGVKYIALPVLDELGLVYHGFSTRVGGVSTGPFSAMNLSLNAGEDKDLVEINRCMFVKALDAGNPEVYTVRQMHGTRVIRIESREHPAEEYRQAQADALVTDQPGVAIGVLTADCVPILLVDPVRRAVAAVHAGREGSLHHVSGHVVRRMARDFGSRPQDLVAAVGPCIETACYPVSEEVAVRAREAGVTEERGLVQREGTFYLDLRRINQVELLEAGLREERIHHVDLCTACHPRTFYSYRRSKGKKTGRMMAVIMLKEEAG